MLVLTFFACVALRKALALDDCSYFNGAAMDQCLVIPWELEWDPGRTDIVGRKFSCVSGKYVLSAYEDNQCDTEITDETGAVLSYPMDVTTECDKDGINCHCGSNSELDQCYISLSDFKVCQNNANGGYDEDDLYFSYVTAVGSCYKIDEHDEKYDVETPLWAINNCNDNEFEPFIKTYYLDSDCTQEQRDPVWDCVVHEESFECDISVTVQPGFYCGLFEGKPLGVCAVDATYVDTDVDLNEEYFGSELYFCDQFGKFYKKSFTGADCVEEDLDKTEPVECDIDHNCVCDISGGINTGDCGYSAFALTQTKTCAEEYLGKQADVTYTAVIENDTCMRSDDHLHGVKYQCIDSTTLDFTLFLNDEDCSSQTACEYTKTVDCSYATGAGNCGYFQQYPVGQCANTTTYTDEAGSTVTYSTKFMCDSDGKLETYTYDNADCFGAEVLKEPCVDCQMNDDGNVECNECKYYVCSDADACDLAEFHQNIVCTAGGIAAESMYNTEYLVMNECAPIHGVYQETVCLDNSLIQKTIYEDDNCATERDVCVVSTYDGGFDFDMDQNEEVLSCVTADAEEEDEDECGYVHVFPLNVCAMSFDSNHEEVFSAMYVCNGDDVYKLHLFANNDCSGDALHMMDVTAQCGTAFECNCGSGACSYFQIDVHDTCLNTDTFMRVILPSDCNKIEDEDLEWDIYLGIKCDGNGQVYIGFYEDEECEDPANILRYKDDDGCTHYVEYDGVCGQYPENRAYIFGNRTHEIVVVMILFVVLNF